MGPKLLLATALSLALPAAAWQEGAPSSSPLFPGMAYVEMFDPDGGQFAQVLFGSETIDIAPVKEYFYSGGFANGDFSVEYAIDYLAGDLYSIDTSNGVTTRIGATITGGFIPYGPKWNALTGTSYVIVPDANCGSTALYKIDLSTAATKLVGESVSCLTAMAIDPGTGTMYAFDAQTDNFVVVDQSSGAIQYFDSAYPFINNASAMDFDPANGLLYVIGEDADPPNPVLYAYVPGLGLEGVGYLGKGFGAFAFAKRDGFFNGFEMLGFIVKQDHR